MGIENEEEENYRAEKKRKEEEKAQQEKKFIKSDGSFKLWWDVFIMICTTFSVITIPLNIAFKPPALQSNGFSVINAIVDLFYLIDILVTFRTTYMDLVQAVPVLDSAKIAERYIKSGNFFIDIVSSIPWDSILNLEILELLGLLKILRMRRLNSMIKTANAKKEAKV